MCYSGKRTVFECAFHTCFILRISFSYGICWNNMIFGDVLCSFDNTMFYTRNFVYQNPKFNFYRINPSFRSYTGRLRPAQPLRRPRNIQKVQKQPKKKRSEKKKSVSFFCKLFGLRKSLHFQNVSFVSFLVLRAQKRYDVNGSRIREYALATG